MKILADCLLFFECSTLRQMCLEYPRCIGHCIGHWLYMDKWGVLAWRQCIWGVVQLWIIHIIKHWLGESKTRQPIDTVKGREYNYFLLIIIWTNILDVKLYSELSWCGLDWQSRPCLQSCIWYVWPLANYLIFFSLSILHYKGRR